MIQEMCMLSRIFRKARLPLTALAVLVLSSMVQAKSPTEGLTTGKVELKSGGPITFGPGGLLFAADPQAAVVYAIATGDTTSHDADTIKVAELDTAIASLLGVKANAILINSIAVNPISNHVYLMVSRGKGPDAMPVILRVNTKGELEEFSLEKVPSAKVELGNAPSTTRSGRNRSPA